MNILVIYAHPETKGHCLEILRNVITLLKKSEHHFEVLDLYKLRYDPIMHKDEHYTAGNRKISQFNRQIQKKITSSDHLIFIYPIWWGSFPAILKGFFDKVLTSGFAYTYTDGKPVKLLKGKNATVFCTSGGSRLFYTLTANMPSIIIRYGILGFCGIRTKVHQFYSCHRLDEKKKKMIKEKVSKALSSFL